MTLLILTVLVALTALVWYADRRHKRHAGGMSLGQAGRDKGAPFH